jgi:hypothetical protein
MKSNHQIGNFKRISNETYADCDPLGRVPCGPVGSHQSFSKIYRPHLQDELKISNKLDIKSVVLKKIHKNVKPP